jgi:hypothetical protein
MARVARRAVTGVIYQVGVCGARAAPGKGSANQAVRQLNIVALPRPYARSPKSPIMREDRGLVHAGMPVEVAIAVVES